MMTQMGFGQKKRRVVGFFLKLVDPLKGAEVFRNRNRTRRKLVAWYLKKGGREKAKKGDNPNLERSSFPKTVSTREKKEKEERSSRGAHMTWDRKSSWKWKYQGNRRSYWQIVRGFSSGG